MALDFCHPQAPTTESTAPHDSPERQGQRNHWVVLQGTGLGSQTSQPRVGQQDGQGGWGAEPNLGTQGLRASGWGQPTFLSPAPGSRPPSDLHRTQCVCSVGYQWLSPAGWVWESEVCAWSSGDRAPALRSPALPAWPSAPVRTRQGQLCEPGERGASSPQGAYEL